MTWQAWHRRLISEPPSGPVERTLRGLLAAASKLYGAGIYCRNRRYDWKLAAVHHVGVPVISVGNLTTGGTGKTPLVAWLADWFSRQGIRVAIVSRGYGSRAGQPNDEALELQLRLPDVPHIQNPDRVAAARRAIEECACHVVLLDDGFQHRRIHRDLDLVLIDASTPFGHDHLLPRGLLREPIGALGRAHVVALSRADQVRASDREALRARIARIAPRAAWLELTHRPQSVLSAAGTSTVAELLRGARIAAFCGIGNPRAFHRTLRDCGADVVAFREFADHFAYGAAEVASLSAWADALDVAGVWCTVKDFVKLRAAKLGRHRLYALAIDVEPLAGRAEFESRLHSIVARCATMRQ
jgi:tetraacyldisaccharide 4'-kinase